MNATFALLTGDRGWSSPVLVEAKRIKDDSLTHSFTHTLSVSTHCISFLCLSGNQLIEFGTIPDQWRSVHKPTLQAEQTWWKGRANHLGTPNRSSSGSFGKTEQGSLNDPLMYIYHYLSVLLCFCNKPICFIETLGWWWHLWYEFAGILNTF